jgi:hypothetical protein
MDQEIQEAFKHDATARREMLKEIVDLGLKHSDSKKIRMTLLGHEIALRDAASNIAKAVEWSETYVKDAVKDLPYASIVMAGVSLVLPLLKNPAAEDAANQDGFRYVTSQMRYYDALRTVMLSEAMEPDARQHFEDLLVNLYQLIIEFEVRSILWLYRSQTKNFFRGVVKYDDWEHQVEAIKKADDDFFSKLRVALSGSGLQKLQTIAQDATASRKALGELVSSVKNGLRFAQKLDRRMSDASDRGCMESLGATNPDHDKERIQNEKGRPLKDSYRWILEHPDFQHWLETDRIQVLWIRGDPGKGKTMLLCGIIDELIEMTSNNANVAFFFCEADQDHSNNATAVLRGLIYMLIKQQPPLISYLHETQGDGKMRFEGVNAWVALSRILHKMLKDPNLKKTQLIVDALDECVTDLNLLLELIQKTATFPNIKWIVSSRNWTNIEKSLNQTAQKIGLSLELNEQSVSAAVEAYIRYKVDSLARRNEWDSANKTAIQSYLSLNASSTFLWVALVCDNLKNSSGWAAEEVVQTFPPELNPFYERMMSQIGQSKYVQICRLILACSSLAYRSLTLDELISLIDLPDNIPTDPRAMKDIIAECGSFLALQGRTISFVHQSAKDYLVEKAANVLFPSGRQDGHYAILLKSLKIMDKTLRRDIYRLKNPGISIDNVHTPDPDPLRNVKYSCIYWVRHLYDSGTSVDVKGDLEDEGKIRHFLKSKYLNWLEALSLLRHMTSGVSSMALLQGILQVSYPIELPSKSD